MSTAGFSPPVAQEFGVLPTLTALEELLAASRGQSPPDILFVWGPHRILVVQPVSLQVRETQFNAQLAPVRADVDVVLNVLETVSQGAPPAVRQAWEENQVVRKRLLTELPRDVSDYLHRILK